MLQVSISFYNVASVNVNQFQLYPDPTLVCTKIGLFALVPKKESRGKFEYMETLTSNNPEKMKNSLRPENSKNQSKKVPALTGSFAGSWMKAESPLVLSNVSKT